MEDTYTLYTLLPEMRGVIRSFLPAVSRVRLRCVCRLFGKEDASFTPPACIVPVDPGSPEYSIRIRRAIRELMNPENKECLEWIQSLRGRYRAGVIYDPRGSSHWALSFLYYPRPVTGPHDYVVPGSEQLRCLRSGRWAWTSFWALDGTHTREERSLAELWEKYGEAFKETLAKLKLIQSPDGIR
jgi:hypothetical protein